MALVAIVGKPNVGKSTLFNRIAKRRKAIESEIPGTTRDRIFTSWQGKSLKIDFCDTGGISFGQNNLEREILAQAQMAVQSADTILFCIDGREGFTQLDRDIANLLRKHSAGKTIFSVVTKCDRQLDAGERSEFLQENVGRESFFISVAQNAGVAQMLERVEADFLARGFANKMESGECISVAIMGQPNAGKSSLINAFLREEKLLTSPQAGTTRDSVDLQLRFEKQDFTLIDTAGIRRRKKREKGLETFSVLRAFRAAREADVCVLLIDSVQGPSAQDQKILAEILQCHPGLILAASKWDRFPGGKFPGEESQNVENGTETAVEKVEARESFLRLMRHKFPFVPWARVVFCSSFDRKNLHVVLRVAKEIFQERQKRVSTGVLNNFLQKLFANFSLRSKRGKIPPKIKFGVQAETSPPRFVFFTSKPDEIHFSSKRFLENRLRQTFGFLGTALEIKFQNKQAQER